jgi:hypothetical protein
VLHVPSVKYVARSGSRESSKLIRVGKEL